MASRERFWTVGSFRTGALELIAGSAAEASDQVDEGEEEKEDGQQGGEGEGDEAQPVQHRGEGEGLGPVGAEEGAA